MEPIRKAVFGGQAGKRKEEALSSVCHKRKEIAVAGAWGKMILSITKIVGIYMFLCRRKKISFRLWESAVEAT